MDDKRFYWAALVYFFGLLLLHVVWWQSLTISAAMTGCWYLSYSRRVVNAIGVVVLMAGLLSWAGVLPSPGHWPQ